MTTFTYTPRMQVDHEAKGNGNTVDYTYFLNKALQHQIETKPDGTVVAEHTYDYDPNGNQTLDDSKVQNADNHAAYINRTTTSTYDPRDRLATVTKTDAGTTVESQSYIHDANNNVVTQTVGEVTTDFTYDRNRLLQSTAAGATAAYNYDPFGRLDTVTSGGQVLERHTYDGFDRIAQETKQNATGGGTTTTSYTYDPLDRTASETTGVGTPAAKTTNFDYLGLSTQVLDENVAGQITKSYQYTPWGQRLSQVVHNTDGTTEDGYYGYNAHTDVEDVTTTTGDTKATYGYTAYGSDDTSQFSGIDTPDPQNPGAEPYNAYRFNAKRFDPASDTYDMGFRNYNPGLNQFLTRDMYNGALDDMGLATDPYTGNRYAYGAGNPTNTIELDGHIICNMPDGYNCGMAESEGYDTNGVHFSGSGGSSMDRTTRHNQAAAAAENEIRSQAAQRGINGDFISLRIPDAAKRCLYKPKSSNCSYGVPDLAFRDSESGVFYIWEVKSASQATKARKEAQWYVDKIRGTGEKAVLGWEIGGPYPVGTNDDVFIGPDQGTVIYGHPENRKYKRVARKMTPASTEAPAAPRATTLPVPSPAPEAEPGMYPGTAYQPGVGTVPLCNMDCGAGPMVYAAAVGGVVAVTAIAAALGPEAAVGAGTEVLTQEMFELAG